MLSTEKLKMKEDQSLIKCKKVGLVQKMRRMRTTIARHIEPKFQTLNPDSFVRDSVVHGVLDHQVALEKLSTNFAAMMFLGSKGPKPTLAPIANAYSTIGTLSPDTS